MISCGASLITFEAPCEALRRLDPQRAGLGFNSQGVAKPLGPCEIGCDLLQDKFPHTRLLSQFAGACEPPCEPPLFYIRLPRSFQFTLLNPAEYPVQRSPSKTPSAASSTSIYQPLKFARARDPWKDLAPPAPASSHHPRIPWAISKGRAKPFGCLRNPETTL